MPSRILETVHVPPVQQQEMAAPATAEASAERPSPAAAQAAAAAQAMMQVVAAPVLKLSFGGVDFSLLPRQSSSNGTVTFEAMGANQAVLSLKNFTGSLRVSAAVTTTTRSIQRQDSVTPSPVATARSGSVELTRKDSTTSSSQPTPTTTNGTKRSTVVEQVVAASRSSPLPYHSPVKRSRSTTTTTSHRRRVVANKKSKPTTTTSTRVSLPTSPIATQKSPSSPRRSSEPDCSQTLQGTTEASSSSNTSQVSLEDPKASDDDDDEEGEDVRPSQSLLQQDEEEEDSDEEMQDTTKEEKEKESQSLEQDDDDKPGAMEEEPTDNNKKGEEDEESVATRKAEDEDDSSLPDGDVAMTEEKEKNKERNETKAPPPPTQPSQPSQMSSAEASQENADAPVPKPLQAPLTLPPKRWGHNMAMVDHNRILLYGGQAFEETKDGNVLPTTLSDVHVFDMETNRWISHIQCDGNRLPRQWASATFLPQRQLMVVFGGEQMNPKTGRTTTADKMNLWCLDTELLLWYPPQVSGDLPLGRSGHTGTLLPSSSNSELVIFGGVKGTKHLNSVSVLDTKAWRWSSPKIQGIAPKARSYHSATAIQAVVGDHHHSDHISNSKNATVTIRQRIIIFGGNDHTESFQTVHVLEKTEGATSSWRWFHPTVSGTPPKPRTGHTATLLADQKTILIYGGWDPNEDEEDDGKGDEDTTLIFEDSFLLDTEKWTWTQGPDPVFAGHSLDASQGTNGGGRRVGHCAILNTSNNKDSDEVLVFGGRVLGDEFTGDFQTLTIPHQ